MMGDFLPIIFQRVHTIYFFCLIFTHTYLSPSGFSMQIEGPNAERTWFHFNRLLEHKNLFKNLDSCLKPQHGVASFSL
jgi:hypothetical protein